MRNTTPRRNSTNIGKNQVCGLFPWIPSHMTQFFTTDYPKDRIQQDT